MFAIYTNIIIHKPIILFDGLNILKQHASLSIKVNIKVGNVVLAIANH